VVGPDDEASLLSLHTSIEGALSVQLRSALILVKSDAPPSPVALNQGRMADDEHSPPMAAQTLSNDSEQSQSSTSPWHALDAEEAARRLGSSLNGLNASEVHARLDRYGPNTLKPPRRKPLVAIVVGQLRSPLIYLLLAAGSASVLMGDVADAAFILLILVVNSAIGATQEARADEHTVALRRSLPTNVRVCRDHDLRVVDSGDLVPGDVVLLEAGDRVPADLRLIRALNLQVDESSLTGESMLVAKNNKIALSPETPLAERLNQLFAGTLVRVGKCEGLVVATGRNTELGHIAETLSGPTTRPPLTKRLDALSRMLGLIAVLLVAAIAAPRLLAGAELQSVVLIAVALAVSIIPEGLPVAVTVALSVATRRMAKRNVIVRHLPAVEGLGACTVVATDKTGTLTVNKLTAERLWLPEHGTIDLASWRQDEAGGFNERPYSNLALLGRSATLCNDALFDAGPGVAGNGDAVDVALLTLAAGSAVKIAELRSSAPRMDEIPFSTERRYAATLNRHDEGHFVHIKGAPEVIVPLCAGINQVAALQHASEMANNGYRVLAVATKPIDHVPPGELEKELSDLTLVGLVGFIDPLRPEARQAVADCRRAGVEVKMITGDHPGTALAIARQLGLASSSSEVVTGQDLLQHDPGSLARIASARVFARVEPSQKVQIVEGLRAAGHVVAMTGDGVNDAPALVRADIGVSMGRDGTDVAREASDLVLTDDNFASIVAGIEEGRAAYANIRKVMYLLVSTGAAEAVMFFLSVVTGLPLPLGAVQLLWLNLVTNGGQDVALAFERPEPDLLDKRPRRPTERLLDGLLIRETAISGLYMGVVAFAVFSFALGYGAAEVEARNLLLFLMVLFENVHAFNVRSETRSAFRVPLRNNWPLIAAVAAAQALHLAAPYIPVLREVLQVQPISPAMWAALVGVAASLLLVVETDKWLRRRSVLPSRDPAD
jgi:P-type Ca2+ transporter type 2C